MADDFKDELRDEDDEQFIPFDEPEQLQAAFQDVQRTRIKGFIEREDKALARIQKLLIENGWEFEDAVKQAQELKDNPNIEHELLNDNYIVAAIEYSRKYRVLDRKYISEFSRNNQLIFRNKTDDKLDPASLFRYIEILTK